ncbi:MULTISPECIES: chromosome segregation protein SMC [unclassified Dehalobacter]|uniref:chromosome segregation protein SMC n=1 Tax=unclassified Dehalobacter TaxID=2635733 RepID=UPI000E6BBFBE|nr:MULTISPECIES: chromosome segregation protein SMC [unclassified Dehalobacter]RJE49208.1 chromosome segregation protein SMC [Dehalobacter sp. MCB1]TCX53250.1 chromosome segregation protein SMC [Dehalobacter sp. 14DCB1]TCX54264.1 chromosome segregation protein SMC [Dehalobacter sp. 12DCB1]
MIPGMDAELFLKSIHIQGFKSFADKIKIDLQPGMSVIIGPNGSGKSNVADAVRWVLGEQSAKSLRGSKMEDVIFSGSSSRRPVGMAEVSLLFDNSSGLFPLDYEEVVITRRVYRDGEGQYFINRTPCRLKDIQELFLDTGSGKEGFSIIGQGRIEEILNLKSDERRLLIEEVAGISKFRLRKREALRKLEDTRQNVDRLRDIIAEVEARIEPLAEQAETAKTSKELTSGLEKLEINLIVNELSDIHSKLTNAQTSEETLRQEFTALTTRVNEEENLSVRGRYELNQLEQHVQDLQGEIYALENKMNEAEHELSLLSERSGYIQEQFGRLQKELASAQETLAASVEKKENFTAKQTLLQEILQNAARDLREKEKQLEELRKLSGEARLEELKTEIFEELSNKSKLASEIAEINQKKEAFLQQEKQYTRNIKAKEAEKESVLQEITAQIEEKQKLEAREIELLGKIENIRKTIQNIRLEQQNAEAMCSELQRKIDQTGARLHALHTLQDSLEGYNRGVKETVLAYRKGQIPCETIFGTVADNIEVEAKYELAVETALGSSLQNIIVEKTEDGKKCIEYLKRTNSGRATFLPLDAIRGTRQSLDDKTRHHGFQGLAVDLVKFDPRFKDIMESLLGRILVADNLDCAIELAKANQYRVRVVTLLGDQVNIGGSLTGGSTRSQSSGLLSRAREIEELSVKTKNMQVELEEKRQRYAAIKKEIEGLGETKETIDMELLKINGAKDIIDVDSKHHEERMNRLEQDFRVIRYELDEVRSELTGLAAKYEGTGQLLNETEQKILALQSEQTEQEQLLKEKTSEAQEISEKMTAAKVEAARSEQEFNQIIQQITEENERILVNKDLIAEKNKEIVGLQQAEQELYSGKEQQEDSVKEYTVQINAQKFKLIELRREKESFSANNLKQEQDIQMLRSQARDMEQQIHQNELRIARWQGEWESGNDRLQEEYHLAWKDALSYLSPEKKDVLQEKIAFYKQKIEELGPVNYTALEEYPETLKRFKFLSAQKNDLDEAGRTLQELIGELDKRMIERFQEGFTAVNEAFKEVFKQLFNGGQAELLLDEPDNLLETGVRIMAQPPGKRPQLLSLLSGGERSFTAIALLFAFLKVKPSPFCLLDEIEAALDEVNVKRFVQYLRKLSKHTQFIIISHRRGTMESADRLYGITMEESGVSKLLTVELEDRIEAPAI